MLSTVVWTAFEGLLLGSPDQVEPGKGGVPLLSVSMRDDSGLARDR